MNGHEHHFEVGAAVLPGRGEGQIGGGTMQLVTLALSDGPGAVDDHGQPSTRPGAFTRLRPSEARELADQLLDCARQAEAPDREAG